MKMRKLCNLLALVILNYFIFNSIVGCNSVTTCQQKEVYRVTSPDNLVDVAVIEKNCGATTSTSTNIYIVPKGAEVKQSPVFVADHLESLDVRWSKPKFLVIQYADARIFQYTNFWNSGLVNDFQYVVNIREYQKDTE